jgi:hypothetical protein
VNELDKLIQTLVNHAHDVHVVLYEKQAKVQLNRILNERPPVGDIVISILSCYIFFSQ